MPQKISTAEWYEKANKMDGCICPTCQTGKENLALYPDYCPHADSLVIEEPNKFCVEIGNGKGPTIKMSQFKCRHYQPLKEETKIENYKVPVIPPLKKSHDPVNCPSHYTTGSIEFIDYIQEKLTPEEFRGYIKGNVIKYLTREQHKNGDEDIRKAQWYLNRLADTLTKDGGGDEN